MNAFPMKSDMIKPIAWVSATTHCKLRCLFFVYWSSRASEHVLDRQLQAASTKLKEIEHLRVPAICIRFRASRRHVSAPKRPSRRRVWPTTRPSQLVAPLAPCATETLPLVRHGWLTQLFVRRHSEDHLSTRNGSHFFFRPPLNDATWYPRHAFLPLFDERPSIWHVTCHWWRFLFFFWWRPDQATSGWDWPDLPPVLLLFTSALLALLDVLPLL